MTTAQIVELIAFVVAGVAFFGDAYLRRSVMAFGLGVLTIALALVSLDVVK